MSEISTPLRVPAGRRGRFAAGIAAAAQIIALFFLVWRPTVDLAVDARRAQPNGGNAYVISVPDPGRFGYRLLGDTNEQAKRSALRVWEDGRPLGPAHSLHDTIRAQGRGAYSHWGADLYFSASDNSDPRTNGRLYELRGLLSLEPALNSSLLAVAALAAALLWRPLKAVAARLPWASWGLLAAAARCATLPVIAAVLWCGGASLARIAGLCLLIYLAGLAATELILPLRRHSADSAVGNRGFIAVALGPVVVLIATIAMRLAGIYTFSSVVVTLSGLVFAALFVSAGFRERIRRPAALLDSNFFVWLGCALAFAFLVAPEDDPFGKASSVYLLQGFDLWLPKDPSEWPYFGEKFVMPMLFATHAIGANMALFSAANPSEYWLYGQHWLNVILSPIVPIGAYLTFRRAMPGWAAVLAAVAFCCAVLGERIWSVRGETLGWIFGFGFLVVFDELLRRVRGGGGASDVRRLAVILAALYFALTLTHGVVALVATLAGFGMAVCFALGERRWSGWRSFLGAGILFSLASALLLAAYLAAFSGSFDKLFFNYDRPPVVGETDPALMFENALFGFPKTAVDAVRGAPYLPIVEAAQVFGLTPLAGAFQPRFASLPIAGFREAALSSVGAMTAAERATYPALLICCCSLYLWRRRLGIPASFRTLFLVSITVYLALVGFGIYMDAVSASTFPVAAARRTFVYIRCFYWLAVVTALADFVLDPVLRPVLRRVVRIPVPPPSPAGRAAVALAFVALLVNSLYANASFSVPGDETEWAAWRLRQIAITGVNSVLPAVPVEAKLRDAFAWRRLLFAPAARPSFIEPLEYIRDHTEPGDWIYTNIISDNQFWYLTGGRYSVLEGSAMYQVYSLQRRAAERMKVFSEIAQSGDLSALDEYGIKYFLLLKGRNCYSECYGYAAYPANIEAFASNAELRRVFENREFVVFARSAEPAATSAPARQTTAESQQQAAAPISTTRGIQGWVESLVFIDGKYRVEGWAAPRTPNEPLTVAAYLGGVRIGGAAPNLARPDVEGALGRRLAHPGFRFDLDATLTASARAQKELRFFAETQDGQRQELEIDNSRSVLPSTQSGPDALALAEPERPGAR